MAQCLVGPATDTADKFDTWLCVVIVVPCIDRVWILALKISVDIVLVGDN